MFGNLKIGTKFIGFTVLVVVISVSVTTFATLYYMKSDLTVQAQTSLDARLALFWDYLRAKGGSETDSFRIEDEKLMIGSYTVNGNYELVDKIKSEVEHAGQSMKRATDKVESGVKLSCEAGSALEKVIHATSGLQEMVQQIASASVALHGMSTTLQALAGRFRLE